MQQKVAQEPEEMAAKEENLRLFGVHEKSVLVVSRLPGPPLRLKLR